MKSLDRHSGEIDVASSAGKPAGGRRVLPRVFRKPARLFNRLLAGNINISRRGWLVMALGAAVISTAGIMANSQRGYSIVAEASSGMGFSVKRISVEGISEISEIDVLTRLDLGEAKSLFALDIVHARESLRKLAWVKDVVVSKSYPDQLIVRINERKPFAIWQNGNALSLIEHDGQFIDSFDARFSELPLLVGEGADAQGSEILYLVEKVDLLKDQVKAYVRIANRRWDLRLKNGVVIKLPDEGAANALRSLVKIDKAHGLLSRDIEVVDLRLGDRMVVQLSEDAIARHAAQSGKKPSTKKEKKI